MKTFLLNEFSAGAAATAALVSQLNRPTSSAHPIRRLAYADSIARLNEAVIIQEAEDAEGNVTRDADCAHHRRHPK